jgi:hypothetical protein
MADSEACRKKKMGKKCMCLNAELIINALNDIW